MKSIQEKLEAGEALTAEESLRVTALLQRLVECGFKADVIQAVTKPTKPPVTILPNGFRDDVDAVPVCTTVETMMREGATLQVRRRDGSWSPAYPPLWWRHVSSETDLTATGAWLPAAYFEKPKYADPKYVGLGWWQNGDRGAVRYDGRVWFMHEGGDWILCNRPALVLMCPPLPEGEP